MRTTAWFASLLLLCGAALASGTVSFDASHSYFTPGDPTAVVAADFNRDGIPDVAYTTFQQGPAQQPLGVVVKFGTGGGALGADQLYPVSSGQPDALIAADMNADGAPDLVVGYTNQPKLTVYLNKGDGTFRAAWGVKLSAPSLSFVAGDFNRDARMDLATLECPSNSPCSLHTYAGSNTGTFTQRQSVAMTSLAASLQTADLDGDGILDLVHVRGTQILVWWGNGNATFTAPHYLGDGPFALNVVIGDFNNDGRLDLAGLAVSPTGCTGCGQDTVFPYKNVGGRNFQESPFFQPGVSFGQLWQADFNGDLNEDLGWFGGDLQSGGFAYIGLGAGNMSFSGQGQLPGASNQTPGGVAVRDMNLDSRDDYVVTDWDGETVAVGIQTGGYRNCAPPSSAKLAAKICGISAGATLSSPLLVRASGNSPLGIAKLEVWIDGKKAYQKWHPQLAKKFTLSSGQHRIAVVAVDDYGEFNHTATTAVNVTVP